MDLANCKLVTHKDCSDGSACAVLFVAAGGKRENVIFSPPSHEDVDDIAFDLFWNWEGNILFADVSVSDATAQLLSNRKGAVALLDHHKSAIPLTKYNFCQIEVDNQRCGSKMLYDWLVGNYGFSNLKKYKEFIDFVDDKDRWQNQIPGSDFVHTLYAILGQKMYIDRLLKNPDPHPTSQELYLVEVDQAKQEQYCINKRQQVTVQTRQVKGEKIRVGFVNAGGPYRSVLGDRLCKDPELDLNVVVMVSGDFISLRSRGASGADCSEICKLNGGGGHVGAGGCDFKNITGKTVLDFVMEQMKFE